MPQKHHKIFQCGPQARHKNMFQLKIKSYFVKLRSKTCGTTPFRIEGFDLNLHIDAEFALRGKTLNCLTLITKTNYNTKTYPQQNTLRISSLL